MSTKIVKEIFEMIHWGSEIIVVEHGKWLRRYLGRMADNIQGVGRQWNPKEGGGTQWNTGEHERNGGKRY